MRPGSDSVARYRAAFAQRNLVSEIEALTARALPPLTLLDLDGWQLRSAGGMTRRANSVWPRAEGARLSLDERLRQSEAFYGQGGLDPAVQLSPSARPQGLERALSARGYRRTPDIEVRTRRVDLLAWLPGGREADLVDRATWLPLWARARGAADRHMAMAERMLERTAPHAAYAVTGEGDALAVARGVLDAGWLGVDLLAATGSAQEPSRGVALLRALATWAQAHGAEHAHLEVDTGDPAAVALSTDGGFRRAYTYRYRVLPRGLVRT